MYFTDGNDFDDSVVIVTFPADEGQATRIPERTALIPITDDDIDEADQLFVVYLEIMNAEYVSRIDIGRSNSTCRIIDNDGML